MAERGLSERDTATLLSSEMDSSFSVAAPSRRPLSAMILAVGIIAAGGVAAAFRRQVPARAVEPADEKFAPAEEKWAAGPLPRHWIFDDLSASEVRAVAAYVIASRPGTSASYFGGKPLKGDYITGTSAVELVQPPKADALAYVNGETDTPPKRFARVTIARGRRLALSAFAGQRTASLHGRVGVNRSLASPDVMEYRVGPIHGCDAGDCDEATVEAAVIAPGSFLELRLEAPAALL